MKPAKKPHVRHGSVFWWGKTHCYGSSSVPIRTGNQNASLEPWLTLQMDPLENPLTTHPNQLGWEISIKQYPKWKFRCIDDLDYHFGNSSVPSRTQTQCGSMELLRTLDRSRRSQWKGVATNAVVWSDDGVLSIEANKIYLAVNVHNCMEMHLVLSGPCTLQSRPFCPLFLPPQRIQSNNWSSI